MSSKAIQEAKGADIASASTTTIWALDGNSMHITGTTTITSFGTAAQAGLTRNVIFDGALTLTHNATSLILPTGANITTAAGDTAIVLAETTANARVLAYLRKDGTAVVAATAATALSGSVIQVVNTQTGATQTCTTAIPNDDTIPQNTEGDQVTTLAITPNNTSNKLKISLVAFVTGNNDVTTVGLFQDSTANALAVGATNCAVDGVQCIAFSYYMTAGTTSSTTFKMRVGCATPNAVVNGISSGRKFGGVYSTSLTIEEIKA